MRVSATSSCFRTGKGVIRKIDPVFIREEKESENAGWGFAPGPGQHGNGHHFTSHRLLNTHMLSHKSSPSFLNDTSQSFPACSGNQTPTIHQPARQREAARWNTESGRAWQHRSLQNDIAGRKRHQQIRQESRSEKDSSVNHLETRFSLKQLLSPKGRRRKMRSRHSR